MLGKLSDFLQLSRSCFQQLKNASIFIRIFLTECRTVSWANHLAISVLIIDEVVICISVFFCGRGIALFHFDNQLLLGKTTSLWKDSHCRCFPLSINFLRTCQFKMWWLDSLYKSLFHSWTFAGIRTDTSLPFV